MTHHIYSLILIFASFTAQAEEKVVSKVQAIEKMKVDLRGEWQGETIAVSPKFYLIFKIDKEDNIDHFIYTERGWKTKTFLIKLSGSLNSKEFNKDIKVTLTTKGKKEGMSFKSNLSKEVLSSTKKREAHFTIM